jgi:hypothetical protein
MGATVIIRICFYTMADNFAATMIATWGKFMNSAFKAIKVIGVFTHFDFNELVILIATQVACCHRCAS